MPLNADSTMNSTRTHSTGSPRCPASPRATPPTHRPSELRYSLRTPGSPGAGPRNDAPEAPGAPGPEGPEGPAECAPEWAEVGVLADIPPIVTQDHGGRYQGCPPLLPPARL